MIEQDNTMLTRVGPGTPMGNLLRRFWFPALLEYEVAAPDCDPVELRLLDEDLVAFRDTAGLVGIVEAYCAHRRAGLFFGRNKEGGLRCVDSSTAARQRTRPRPCCSAPQRAQARSSARTTSPSSDMGTPS